MREVYATTAPDWDCKSAHASSCVAMEHKINFDITATVTCVI